jgi:nucleoside-diphosphate-sugar epimerase
VGGDVEPHYDAPRPGDVLDSQADIGKARRLLAYEPHTGFADGLEKTVAWYRANQSTPT